MGNTASTARLPPPPPPPIRRNAEGKPVDENGVVLKPCCACPETKKARDQCILETGDEEACKSLILAHKKCLRDLGFNV